MVVITTSMVRDIRRLRAANLSGREVAAMLGISIKTVYKYQSDETQQAEIKRVRARHAKEYQNPDIVARKRATAKAHYYKMKEAKNEP